MLDNGYGILRAIHVVYITYWQICSHVMHAQFIPRNDDLVMRL
jgi:hypothetical protein